MKKYKDFRKQKKYNGFRKSSGKVIFSPKQLEKIKKRIEIDEIKKRIHKIQAILKMEVGEHNAKRLLSYPCINNGITHKGICFVCGFENDLIRFDDNTSICEHCASDKNLI